MTSETSNGSPRSSTTSEIPLPIFKSLMTSSDKPYTLTNEQQKILDSQIGLDPKLYTDADKLYDDLKSKYEL